LRSLIVKAATGLCRLRDDPARVDVAEAAPPN
jgi:hypothetical protein